MKVTLATVVVSVSGSVWKNIEHSTFIFIQNSTRSSCCCLTDSLEAKSGCNLLAASAITCHIENTKIVWINLFVFKDILTTDRFDGMVCLGGFFGRAWMRLLLNN